MRRRFRMSAESWPHLPSACPPSFGCWLTLGSRLMDQWCQSCLTGWSLLIKAWKMNVFSASHVEHVHLSEGKLPTTIGFHCLIIQCVRFTIRHCAKWNITWVVLEHIISPRHSFYSLIKISKLQFFIFFFTVLVWWHYNGLWSFSS